MGLNYLIWEFLENVSKLIDLKGGCLHGGHFGRSQLHYHQHGYKGVQVFTYKELEVATSGFSEGNVIGRGGFGVVYRGVLSDGTVAAIKMFHRVGKQGERAFRVEVNGFICYFFFFFLCPFSYLLMHASCLFCLY